MTAYHGLDAILDGLDADPWERQQLAEVLAEIATEPPPPAAGYGSPEPYPDPEPEPGPASPYGPWDDAFTALDRSADLEGQRVGEDIVAELDRRPSSEDVLTRAMRRIEAGTYTQAPGLRGDPARSADGRYAHACGDLDDFGRCGARYHDPRCSTAMESRLPTGSLAEADQWIEGLASRTAGEGVAEQLGLANPPEPGDGLGSWGSFLDPGGTADPGLHERMMAYLTQAAAEQEGTLQPAVPGREPGPDVSAIREALGL